MDADDSGPAACPADQAPHAYLVRWTQTRHHDTVIRLTADQIARLGDGIGDPTDPVTLACLLDVCAIAAAAHAGDLTSTGLGVDEVVYLPYGAQPRPETLGDLPALVHLPALTDAQARAVLTELASRHGWAYAVWDRVDAQNELAEHRCLTDEQWRAVTRTEAWDAIPRAVARKLAETSLFSQALIEAGVQCAECGAALGAPVTQTARLCDRCRTGPGGQPAVVDAHTGGLYWLHGDTLMYAEPHPHDAPHCWQARPVTPGVRGPDADERARYAVACLRRQPAPAV